MVKQTGSRADAGDGAEQVDGRARYFGKGYGIEQVVMAWRVDVGSGKDSAVEVI
jgi:hypothetical protein